MANTFGNVRQSLVKSFRKSPQQQHSIEGAVRCNEIGFFSLSQNLKWRGMKKFYICGLGVRFLPRKMFCGIFH